MFIGGTIHDVAQVVGAGYAISPEAGDAATLVKLMRVAMLRPRRARRRPGRPPRRPRPRPASARRCCPASSSPSPRSVVVGSLRPDPRSAARRRHRPCRPGAWSRRWPRSASRRGSATSSSVGLKPVLLMIAETAVHRLARPARARRRTSSDRASRPSEKTMNATTVFVPGLRDHVAEHWQTHMAASIPGSVTVEPLTENRLSREARVAALEAALAGIEGDIVSGRAQRRRADGRLLGPGPDPADPRRSAGHAGRRRVPACPPAIPSIDALEANGWLPMPRAASELSRARRRQPQRSARGVRQGGGPCPMLARAPARCRRCRPSQSGRRLRPLARGLSALGRDAGAPPATELGPGRITKGRRPGPSPAAPTLLRESGRRKSAHGLRRGVLPGSKPERGRGRRSDLAGDVRGKRRCLEPAGFRSRAAGHYPGGRSCGASAAILDQGQ